MFVTDSPVQEAKRQEQGRPAVAAPYTAVQHMEYVPAEYFRGEARSVITQTATPA